LLRQHIVIDNPQILQVRVTIAKGAINDVQRGRLQDVLRMTFLKLKSLQTRREEQFPAEGERDHRCPGADYVGSSMGMA
jgi:hypothetical protein